MTLFTISVKDLFQRRYMASVLGLIVMFMMTALRINISIAMVAMVNDTTSNTPENYSNESAECPAYELHNSTRPTPVSNKFECFSYIFEVLIYVAPNAQK